MVSNWKIKDFDEKTKYDNNSFHYSGKYLELTPF